LRKWESKGQFTSAATESAFGRFRALFALRIPTESVLQVSFDLRSRFRLSHWDSMLLAACKESGVTTLDSEDLAAGMNYDGVTIVNPFA
jgi:predicted nucleic acid-binding protein